MVKTVPKKNVFGTSAKDGDIIEYNNIKYRKEDYNISDLKCYRLIELDTNEEWYPLTAFIKQMLSESERRADYIKSVYLKDDRTKRFFRVIAVPWSNRTAKRWFVNREVINIVLSEYKIRPEDIKTLSLNVFKRRQKYEAMLHRYFNVVPKDKTSIFVGFTPDLEKYDLWSILCIRNDYTLRAGENIWQKCSKCGFYYPLTRRYFKQYNEYYSNTCLQCDGINFKCLNKHIQYIYKENGYELLYQYYEKRDPEALFDIFGAWL